MTILSFMIGASFGMVVTLGIYTAYDKIEQAREEEARERHEARQRRIKLRQDMNRPRDPQEQNIIEQARAGLQRREEG